MDLKLVVMGGVPDSEAEIVDKLRTHKEIGSASNEMRNYALEHLRTARSAAVRNAAALALSELQATDAVKDIVDVIMKPDAPSSAGTLLYAIEELGGDLPLEAFVHVLVNGSYEARQHALDLLAAGQVVATDDDDIEELLRTLEPLLSSANPEKAEAAADAVEILRSAPHGDRSAGPGR